MTDGETDDEFDIGAEPRCEVCGTVMRTVDGGYRCGGCGWELEIPWVERPPAGEDLPGIHGG
ncbi:hypothetical protein [Microbacterium oleivorans]|uniref:Uncharacterized protein n=1 Tax=Microbacterium oleivorans TaxID=273677 RepID=A0A7D5ER91_9MICO|nr:hypothetical protein [Microbacterium oleivorans]QLD10865.1 hypothetical protein HW566_03155 [Microbacterium oleivorans]